MTFHSLTFLVFFGALALALWTPGQSRALRSGLLLGSSLLFYASYEWLYLPLLLGSIGLDYFCGARIHAALEQGRAGRAKRFMALSLVGNLGVLAGFKYTDWIARSFDRACAALGHPTELAAWPRTWLPEAFIEGPTGQILVPVGISFYTFQTLSYTIDIYRGTLRPARHIRDFALFVSFFPQLVAGPIVRAAEFLPQLERPFEPRSEHLRQGLRRFLIGLVKKVALADVLGAELVDPIFADPQAFSWGLRCVALYGFALQIYLDFSAYSDIAIGLGRVLGFELPENFDRPYRSTSVREFWRRWHITLSTWVRDYLFISLGGSRGGAWRTARNLTVSMVAIGLWHGASLLWVSYGLLQALAMLVERWVDPGGGGRSSPLKRPLRWLLTFHFIVFSCLLIRAGDQGTLWAMVAEPGEHAIGRAPRAAWLALGAAFAAHFAPGPWKAWSQGFFSRAPLVALGFLTAWVLGLLAFLRTSTTDYIYFQF